MQHYVVTLDEAQRKELTRIVSKSGHRSQKGINALILLSCDAGDFNDNQSTEEATAETLRISMSKVNRVNKQFVEKGLEVALGDPASYFKVDDEFVAHLVALVNSEPPENRTQWSLRLLADRAVELGYVDAISHETVRKVLKKAKSNRGNK